MLKKSSEGTRHEISCPLGGIAHHRHEGTGRHTQNPVLTARRAVEMASGVVPPLQNQIRRILAPPNSRLFQQPQPSGDIRRHFGNAVLAIEWLLKECSSLGGGKAIQFQQIWMASGEHQLNVLDVTKLIEGFEYDRS